MLEPEASSIAGWHWREQPLSLLPQPFCHLTTHAVYQFTADPTNLCLFSGRVSLIRADSHSGSLAVVHSVGAGVTPSQKKFLVIGWGKSIPVQQPPAPKSGQTAVKPHPEDNVYEAAIRHVSEVRPMPELQPLSSAPLKDGGDACHSITWAKCIFRFLSLTAFCLLVRMGRWEHHQLSKSLLDDKAQPAQVWPSSSQVQSQGPSSAHKSKGIRGLGGHLTWAKLRLSRRASPFPLF